MEIALCISCLILLQGIIIRRISMNFENITWIIPIYFHRKSSKGHHIDPVTIFQNIKIAVTDAVRITVAIHAAWPTAAPIQTTS